MTSTDTKQRYSLISLGCARSLVDSEQMVNALNQSGYTVVPEGSDEAIVILNTCSFIQSAIEETKENIRALVAKKQRREIQYIVVVGCYVSRFAKEELALSFPEVDLWLSTFEEDRLVEQLNEAVFQKRFLPDAQAKPYTKLTRLRYKKQQGKLYEYTSQNLCGPRHFSPNKCNRLLERYKNRARISLNFH